MKHILRNLMLLVAITICSSSLTYAITPVTLTLHIKQSITDDPEVPDPEDEGKRKPGKPFSCTFDSDSGIEFIGQETPEFALFEIYVTDTECIYASGDEFGFINKLFTLSGSYQICLTTTDGCVYAGYITL